MSRDQDVEKLGQFRQGFEQFDAVLGQLHPRHASTRQPSRVEDDAPGCVRELWRVLGLSDATRSRQKSETRSAGRAAMQEQLAEWFASPKVRERWGVGSVEDPALWKRFPEKLRVVFSSSDRLVYADEGSSTFDPMLHFVTPNRPTPAPYAESWLAVTLHTLLSVTAGQRKVAYSPAAKLEGPAVLAPAYPGFSAVADGVWRLSEPASLQDQWLPVHKDVLLYRSLARYHAMLMGLSDEALRYMKMPPAHQFFVKRSAALAPDKVLDPGARSYDHLFNNGQRAETLYTVGTLQGRLVWVREAEHDDERTFAVEPREAAFFQEWLASKKAKVKRVDELRGCEEMGW